MNLQIGAIGRLKDRAEVTLFERYQERLDAQGRSVALGPLTLAELPESRAATADLRRIDEADRLLNAVRGADFIVALEVTGSAFTSEKLAAWLARQRDEGARSIAFVIGGPDGHGPALLAAARLKLSLGAFTLPHGLARVVLAEQLYRSATILSGHPYHRA